MTTTGRIVTTATALVTGWAIWLGLRSLWRAITDQTTTADSAGIRYERRKRRPRWPTG